MIRIILLSFIYTSVAIVTLKADPTPTPAPKAEARTVKDQSAKKSAAKSSSAEGWSVVKGTWIHSDGYKYVNGQVVRIGSQTHKPPPQPPTQAELDAAKGTVAPSPAAAAAAAKVAEKQRNLTPKAAPQTGSHL